MTSVTVRPTWANDNPTIQHLTALATYFGVPVSYFLDDEQTRRVDAQLDLLQSIRDAGVTEIALRTGWNSIGTFGRIFRDITGESPGEFRARQRAIGHGHGHVPECFVRAAHRPDLRSAVSEKRRHAAPGKKALQSTEVP